MILNGNPRGMMGKFLLLVCCLWVGACSTPARVVVRDSSAVKETKKIAVMPFFLANDLSVESNKPGYLSRKTFDWSAYFAKRARVALSGRCEFIAGESVDAELQKIGNYRYSGPKMDRSYRTGYTLAEAIQVGRSLGADAVLVGAAAIADAPGYSRFFFRAVSVRLLDVRTGRVVWGASAHQDRASDDHPIQKIVDKMREGS